MPFRFFAPYLYSTSEFGDGGSALPRVEETLGGLKVLPIVGRGARQLSLR